MRRVPLILALLLAARGAGAQTYGPDGRLLVDSEVSTLPANAMASGSLTGPTQAVAIASPAGGGSFSVQVTGTWTGQLDFQVTVDGTNWVSKNLYQYASGGQLANATSGNGLFLGSIAGATQFRVYATALSSGTALVTVNVTLADGIGNLIKSVRLNEYTPVSGRLPVDGSGVTQPVSGTVTANAGTGTFAVSGPLTDTQLRATAVPVSGTFWQATQPVSAASLPLPTGAATSALQDGIVKDGAGDTTQANVSGGRLHVDGSGVTQPVSGTISASQSGAWTVQPGNTANTTPWLASIHDGTTKAAVFNLAANDPLSVAVVDGTGSQITSFGGGIQYTEADTDASISGTAVMWEDAADTLRAVSAAKPLPVNVVAGGAGDGKILDGTGAGQADVFDYTNGRPLAVRLTDTNGDYVGAGAGTQYQDGAAQATPTGTVALGHDGSNVRAITTDSSGDIQTDVLTMPAITGTVTANAGTNLNTSALLTTTAHDDAFGTAGSADAQVRTIQGIAGGTAVPVSGTFWQATQPVSIAAAVTVAQATAANLNATVTDGTGALTVDGTVTANQGGAPWSVAISQTTTNNDVDVATIAAGDANIGNVDVVTMPSVTVGTFPDNEPFNLAQVAGATVATGNGTAAGSVRVALASDGTGQLSTVTTVGTVTNLTNLPNEGQQTAANSISTTLDTDNDPIGATGAAPPGEVVDIGGRTSGADTTGLMTGITVCTDHVAVDVVTATTTLLITGVANRHVRICSINLVTAAANNVALIAGTGATCGTSTAGINGGTTAAEGWNFAANGGLAQGSGFGEIMSTKVSGGATGDSVCVVTSAATQLSGTISYAIY